MIWGNPVKEEKKKPRRRKPASNNEVSIHQAPLPQRQVTGQSRQAPKPRQQAPKPRQQPPKPRRRVKKIDHAIAGNTDGQRSSLSSATSSNAGYSKGRGGRLGICDTFCILDEVRIQFFLTLHHSYVWFQPRQPSKFFLKCDFETLVLSYVNK